MNFKRIVFVSLGCMLVLLFAVSASAQDKVGMYPRNAFEKKPLAVGTPVWVNIGDNKCAYPPNDEKYPRAADKCFISGDYVRGKIVEITFVYWGKTRMWAYRIEYTIVHPDGRRITGRYNGGLDEAYMTYNLPPRWAEYSKYFIALNW